ncbi:MAG: hypothetical protein NVS4B8_27840 [Herpetosiphon sp.]
MVTFINIVTILEARSGNNPLTAIPVATLLSVLILKEIMSGLLGRRAKRVSSALDIAVWPLALVFIITAVTNLVSLLH